MVDVRWLFLHLSKSWFKAMSMLPTEGSLKGIEVRFLTKKEMIDESFPVLSRDVHHQSLSPKVFMI